MLFAGTVCLVHAGELSGYQPLLSVAGLLSAPIAVKSFFVVSGFLIFMSIERSPAIKTYTSKRLRRIYPAYFAVVMLCAFGLVAFSSEPPGAYFSADWGKYVLANLSFLNFLQPTLPGVFSDNIHTAVNGALWTLKIEVAFYVLVPLIVILFRRFGRMPVIVILYVLSVAYSVGFSLAGDQTSDPLYAMLGRQVPGQLSYFMAGAFLFYNLAFFERNMAYFLSGAVAIMVARVFWPMPLFEPFALAAIVISAGLFAYLGNFGKYGDFSYGTYILHFPIIQMLLYLGWQHNSPWLFLASVILLTLLAAFAMWHLVEKRFLSRQSHYIASTKAVKDDASSISSS